jgi:5-methylcytosine-specific restriction enzyme subunit McrC
MTHRSVREWGEIPVSAGGCARGFSVREAESLVAASRDHPLGGDKGSGILSDHRHYLKARQMVGVIAAPGCSLEILPKVDPDGPDEDAPSVRRQLVNLLDLALDLGIEEGATATMAHGAESLLEILIRTFAERLIAETRRGLPRLYMACEDDLPSLRGRLDVARQFTINAVRPDRLACRYDVLSHDIALMQVMACAVVNLRRHARTPSTQRLLDELRYVFADVTPLPLSALPWDRVKIDRTNRRWECLFRLARLLLKREWQTTRHRASAQEGLTLLFAMNDLFEAAVVTLLSRALAGKKVEIVAQGGLRYCLGDFAEGGPSEGRHFQTRPDILLKRGGEVVAVIDTKWKALAANPLDRMKGVTQGDVYQMMAYARLYRCERLMLLYPAAPGALPIPARWFGIDGGHEALTIGRIDLAQALTVAVTALRELVEPILAPKAASIS